MGIAISSGFRHPLGDGTLTEARYLQPGLGATPADATPSVDGILDSTYVSHDGITYSGFFSATDFGPAQIGKDQHWSWHLGEDWNGDGGGSTDLGVRVNAISNGEIIQIGSEDDADTGDKLGNYVVIRHDLPAPIDIVSGGKTITTSTIVSLYAHLDRNPFTYLSLNQIVTAGQQIGEIGMSGDALSPHLHFEIRLGTQYHNIDGYYNNGTDTPTEREGWVDPTDFINGHRTFSSYPTIQYGTDEKDLLYGGADANYFYPKGGNDLIYGNGGIDTVEYQAPIDKIWFYRGDTTTTVALVAQRNSNIKGDVLFDVERLSDNGGHNTIDLTAADVGVLYGQGAADSSRYILPTDQYNSVSVDGGGGQDVLVLSGRSSDWHLTDVSGSGYQLTSSMAASPAGALAAAPSNMMIDIVNIEAVEFADGTFSIPELLGSEPVGGYASVGVRVLPGEAPFTEGNNGNWRTYDFQLFMDRTLLTDVTVHWTVEGYGSNGTDAADFGDGVVSGQETIKSGSLTQSLGIDVLGDNVPEFDETFRLKITIDPANTDVATIGQSTAYGTIHNDDGLISLNDDYGDDFATASLLPSDPNALNGAIEQPTDVDVFKLYCIGGVSYQIYFGGINSGGVSNRLDDATYSIYDKNGDIVPITDTNPDPNEVATVLDISESGKYYLHVSSTNQNTTGYYQILVNPTNDSYKLILEYNAHRRDLRRF